MDRAIEKTCNTCGRPFRPTAAQIRDYQWRCSRCCAQIRKTPEARERHRKHKGRYHQHAHVKAKRRVYQKRRTERQRGDHEHLRRAAARYAVREAIAAGTLTKKPCEVCGSRASQAHHPDYSKPLDVQWLCRPHHYDAHVAMAKQ